MFEKHKIEADQPEITFVPSVSSGSKVDGQYPTYDWEGTINGQPSILSASLTLNTKLLELGASLGTGVQGQVIYISLVSFKTKEGEDRKAWKVSTTPSKNEAVPTPQPQAKNAAQLNSVPSKDRMITMLALLKFVNPNEPSYVKVTQAFEMERLIRKGFELQDKHGEVTADQIAQLASVPKDSDETVKELFG